MKAFEQKAAELFERFNAALAKVDLTRAQTLHAAVAAVVALGTVSVPAEVMAASYGHHAGGSVHTQARSYTSSGRGTNVAVMINAGQQGYPQSYQQGYPQQAYPQTYQAQQSYQTYQQAPQAAYQSYPQTYAQQGYPAVPGTPVVLNGQQLRAMQSAQMAQTAQAMAAQRSAEIWEIAVNGQVAPQSVQAQRAAYALGRTVEVAPGTHPVKVLVCDVPHAGWQVAGLDAQRVVIQKSLVDALSESGLVYALARERARAGGLGEQHIVLRYHDLLEAAAEHARLHPVMSPGTPIQGYRDLEARYLQTIPDRLCQQELSLDEQASKITHDAGYDWAVASREAIGATDPWLDGVLPPAARMQHLEALHDERVAEVDSDRPQG
jgi:hypothetical protein